MIKLMETLRAIRCPPEEGEKSSTQSLSVSSYGLFRIHKVHQDFSKSSDLYSIQNNAPTSEGSQGGYEGGDQSSDHNNQVAEDADEIGEDEEAEDTDQTELRDFQRAELIAPE